MFNGVKLATKSSLSLLMKFKVGGFVYQLYYVFSLRLVSRIAFTCPSYPNLSILKQEPVFKIH